MRLPCPPPKPNLKHKHNSDLNADLDETGICRQPADNFSRLLAAQQLNTSFDGAHGMTRPANGRAIACAAVGRPQLVPSTAWG